MADLRLVRASALDVHGVDVALVDVLEVPAKGLEGLDVRGEKTV